MLPLVHRHNAVEPAYNICMRVTRKLTAIIEREDDAYVALCPELDIASQGETSAVPTRTAAGDLIERRSIA
jgi:hypothetical protein